MTDRDVVARAGGLLRRSVIPVAKRQEHYKIPYLTCVKGTPAVELMRLIEPLMSGARRRQIARAIASWHGRPTRWAAPVSDLRDQRLRSRGSAKRVVSAPLRPVVEGHEGRGEGAFTVTRGDGHTYPVVAVKMCARDVVARAGEMLAAPSIARREPENIHWRPTYGVKISGAAAVKWMLRLRPFMGIRRTAAIDAALAAYHPIDLVDPPKICVVAACDRPHEARGLCHKHYMSWMRDVAKGRTPRVTPLR